VTEASLVDYKFVQGILHIVLFTVESVGLRLLLSLEYGADMWKKMCPKDVGSFQLRIICMRVIGTSISTEDRM
jgi:hypothetical protein